MNNGKIFQVSTGPVKGNANDLVTVSAPGVFSWTRLRDTFF